MKQNDYIKIMKLLTKVLNLLETKEVSCRKSEYLTAKESVRKALKYLSIYKNYWNE